MMVVEWHYSKENSTNEDKVGPIKSTSKPGGRQYIVILIYIQIEIVYTHIRYNWETPSAVLLWPNLLSNWR